ncbi:MAG: hypothetical protein HC767_07330 [Akkermansiaceae bacterium]|nr:hypothetical protein [Akkermansiaceae bacterium]
MITSAHPASLPILAWVEKNSGAAFAKQADPVQPAKEVFEWLSPAKAGQRMVVLQAE